MPSVFKAQSVLLPQKFAAVILLGPTYDKLLLPVHVLFGKPIAATSQNTSHVKRLKMMTDNKSETRSRCKTTLL